MDGRSVDIPGGFPRRCCDQNDLAFLFGIFDDIVDHEGFPGAGIAVNEKVFAFVIRLEGSLLGGCVVDHIL